MEERKYTFYDRYQKVKYANITAEELEVLNIFGSIIFFVGLTLPRYRFSKPSASLDMNLR